MAAVTAEFRRLLRLVLVLLHISYGFVLALLSGAVFNPHRPVVHRLAHHWMRCLLPILGVRVSLHGIPVQNTTLVVSNHVSWLDILVIGGHHPVTFLSKAEVRHWPVIGWLAAVAGTLFIRRGSGDSRQKSHEIAQYLKSGRSILVFPEGTSTRGERVRRFFPHLFVASTMASVPVQPLAIGYPDTQGRPDPELAFVGDDHFHTHLWRLLRRRHIPVRLSFCQPLDVGLSSDQLATESRLRIALELEAGFSVLDDNDAH